MRVTRIQIVRILSLLHDRNTNGCESTRLKAPATFSSSTDREIKRSTCYEDRGDLSSIIAEKLSDDFQTVASESHSSSRPDFSVVDGPKSRISVVDGPKSRTSRRNKPKTVTSSCQRTGNHTPGRGVSRVPSHHELHDPSIASSTSRLFYY